MWKNKWDMDTFPANYLFDFALARQPDAIMTGNGKKDFKAIDCESLSWVATLLP